MDCWRRLMRPLLKMAVVESGLLEDLLFSNMFFLTSRIILPRAYLKYFFADPDTDTLDFPGSGIGFFFVFRISAWIPNPCF
jgi:hypothetical protein